jgi:hypothetical protein
MANCAARSVPHFISTTMHFNFEIIIQAMPQHGLSPRKRKRNLLAPSTPKRAFESQNALKPEFGT